MIMQESEHRDAKHFNQCCKSKDRCIVGRKSYSSSTLIKILSVCVLPTQYRQDCLLSSFIVLVMLAQDRADDFWKVVEALCPLFDYHLC